MGLIMGIIGLVTWIVFLSMASDVGGIRRDMKAILNELRKYEPRG